MCFLCVCGSAVWIAGPVQVYSGILLDGGTVQIFLSGWLCCSGYGTVEMVGGWSVFSAFSSLLSVFLAVGCLR